jgi:shikimate dehydrogenase
MTDRYGVVGHPVGHSLSPFIHGVFARETGQDIGYRLYDFTPEEFAPRVRDFFTLGGRGLNVTVPHKVAAAKFASQLTPRATHAGAVNTLAIQSDGAILGDNTDGAGLVRDLVDNLGLVITRRRVLLVGAGGATRGAIAPLLALEPAQIVIANRTAERAHEMANRFAELGPIHGVGISEAARISPEGDVGATDAGPFDLIINATSASLSGEMPDLADSLIGPETVCYDMAYGKTDTVFMQWAQRRGCTRAIQGLGMLVEQAAESFRVWRGIKPATASVLAALQERVNAS